MVRGIVPVCVVYSPLWASMTGTRPYATFRLMPEDPLAEFADRPYSESGFGSS